MIRLSCATRMAAVGAERHGIDSTATTAVVERLQRLAALQVPDTQGVVLGA